jgi:hypothetical protein
VKFLLSLGSESIVLYGCETLSVTFCKEYRLRVFENRVLRNTFASEIVGVTGGWKKLHNEELCDCTCQILIGSSNQGG